MNILSSLGSSTDILLDALKDKSRGAGKGETLALKDNQLLEARVLKVMSQTQAMLLIDGKKLTATTRMPLSENDILQLKVTRTESGQVLKILEQQAAAPANEALAEMRKLGQEGPYGKISTLLNARLPSDIAESLTPVTSDSPSLKGGAALPAEHPEPVTDKNPATPLRADSGQEKFTRTFATEPRIPQPLKIALLASDLPDGVLPDLAKPLTDMARILSVPLLSDNAPEEMGTEATRAAIKEKLLASLPPEQRRLALQFLDSPDLSWEGKMTRVLAEGGLKTLKEALAQMNLTPKETAFVQTGKQGAPPSGSFPSALSGGTETTGKQPTAFPPETSGTTGIKVPDAPPSAVPVVSSTSRAPESPGLPGGASQADSAFPETLKPPVGRLSSDVSPLPGREIRASVPGTEQAPLNPALAAETTTGPEKSAAPRQIILAPDAGSKAEQPEPYQAQETVRRSLENLFNRLEADALKQVGLPDRESTRTLALIRKIRDLVDSFTLSPDRDYNGTTVRNLVRDSGLMWESKLRGLVGQSEKQAVFTRETVANLIEGDVKALSMKGTEFPETIRQNVGETLKTFSESLEKMQLLNTQGADDSGKYLLPLPYVHDGNLRFGQLFIDLDRKKEAREDDKDRIIRVAFLLSMSGLGPVQAGVAIYKKSITGEFLVGSQEVKALMDEALPDLGHDLSAKGYTVRKLECRLTDPDTLASASLVEKMAAPEGGGLNIRI